MSLPRRSCSLTRVAVALLLSGRSKLVLAVAAVSTVGLAGCAQQPQQLAAASHGKEYFPSSKYGPISRRVIADGQPIPRGGGQYLVGKPYTVAGQTYYPSERHIAQVGNASWYGDAFHGRLTANGEIYDRNGFTAAHPTLPLPSYARVTNLRNNMSMIVRVNDRGPYASNRIMDVSGGVAEALDFKRTGTARVKMEYIARASLAGSDDTKLLATLRVNGPAQWPGDPATAVAEAAPPARVASMAPYAGERRGERDRPAALIETRDDEVRPARMMPEPHRSRESARSGAERPERAGRARDSAPFARDRPPALDARADLARLIEKSRVGGRLEPGVRAEAGGRSMRIAAAERSPIPRPAGRDRPGRGGAEPTGRSMSVAQHGAVSPPQRPFEARVARGGGRGWEDQHRFRQAGLRLATSRED